MEQELDDEGKKLWNMIKDDDFAKNLVVKKKRNKKITDDTPENVRIRLSIRKLQQNSKTVVKEAEAEIKKLTKEEKYYAAYGFKVAHLVHTNLIERLQRILEGKEPFDFDIDLDDDSESSDGISEVFVR